MDTITYDIYLRALWAVLSTLVTIDLDLMLVQARENGTDADVDLILALRLVKAEFTPP